MSLYNQIATYWAKGSKNKHAEISYSAPAELSVRWEQKSMMFKNEAGEELVSTAIVYLTQDVAEGDYLHLGTSIITSPAGQTGFHKIRGFSKIPSLGANKFTRKAWL